MNYYLAGEKSCTLPSANYCASLVDQCDHGFYNIAIRYYCQDHTSVATAIYTVLILACLALAVIGLSLAVSNYLFPNLHDLSIKAGINENVLSFVVVPFINSFPDIINYFYAIRMNSVDLVLGQLVGSNMIILVLVVGLISFLKPFSIRNNKYMLFDLVWLLVVLIVFNLILRDGKITRVESLVMAAIYLAHTAYFFFSDKEVQFQSLESIPLVNDLTEELDELANKTTETALAFRAFNACIHQIDRLLSLVLPDNTEKSSFAKAWYLVVLSAMVTYKFELQWQFFPVVGLICSLAIALDYWKPTVVANNFIGIFSTTLLISIISLFVLKLLKNWGLILKINEYLLGLLIFSVANSINDLITNITLSFKFNSTIGLNACLGTPLLLILIGVGYNSLLVNKFNLVFDIKEGLFMSSISLTVIIALLIVVIPLNNWTFNKLIGGTLICCWLLINVLNVVLEQYS